MRYCYLGALQDHDDEYASRTPRRYRCQPDLALRNVTGVAERDHVRQRMQPIFSSTQFAHPNYARLSWRCPKELRSGADTGSEMGVFNHLMEQQRESNLREAVRRYLPFGLEMNIIYADEETRS